MEKLTVDRPFVFLIQDHKEDLVIAAGKLHVPTIDEEENEGEEEKEDAEKEENEKV